MGFSPWSAAGWCRVVTAFLTLKLGVLTFNMIRFPVLRRRSSDDRRPAVKQRIDEGETDGAPEIAGQIE